MRLREDSHWDAGHKRAVLLGAVLDPREDDHTNWDPHWLVTLNDDSFEAAQPGDVWEVRGSPTDPGTISWQRQGREDWVMIGYGLWCPNERCTAGVHLWDHASDCPAPRGSCKVPRPDAQVQSCWAWSGSIEDGTLTASPSLFVDHESCGWHGFLQNGEMAGQVEDKYRR
jgi:hypothetical protein